MTGTLTVALLAGILTSLIQLNIEVAKYLRSH